MQCHFWIAVIQITSSREELCTKFSLSLSMPISILVMLMHTSLRMLLNTHSAPLYLGKQCDVSTTATRGCQQ